MKKDKMPVELHLLIGLLSGIFIFEITAAIGSLLSNYNPYIDGEAISSVALILGFIFSFIGFCLCDWILKKFSVKNFLDKCNHNFQYRLLISAISTWLVHVIFMILCFIADAILQLTDISQLLLQFSTYTLLPTFIIMQLFYRRFYLIGINLKLASFKKENE